MARTGPPIHEPPFVADDVRRRNSWQTKVFDLVTSTATTLSKGFENPLRDSPNYSGFRSACSASFSNRRTSLFNSAATRCLVRYTRAIETPSIFATCPAGHPLVT